MRRVKISLSIVFGLFFGLSLYAQKYDGYYDSVRRLKGEKLKSGLYEIIKDHIEFPYTSKEIDTWDILKESDQDKEYQDNVILFYTGWSANGDQEYNNKTGWDREHVWAKSHGKFKTKTGIGTDLHNLKPTDISVNGARGNEDFDFGGEIYIDKEGPTECRLDKDSWEPRDEVKGDVARILFYMAVRYEGDDGEPDLELVDEVKTFEMNASGEGYHGKLSTLLEWHRNDPPDEFEIRRNEIIYNYQKNRNPFIDHPKFVKKIWGSPRKTSRECKLNSVYNVE